METLPVGLIGTGRIGQLHAENLRGRIPNAELVMVTDIDLESAQRCAGRWGVREADSDYRRILEHPEIKAVLICSSTDTHSQMITEAAAAGKHIFCEKPIDFDLDRIDKALDAVEQAGVLLQIGFNRRFDANYQRLRKAVMDGEVGTPEQLLLISRDPAPPPIDYVRRSGGIFLDMTIHDFDMARFLIGSEVIEVYATGGVMVDPAIGDAGDLDTITVLLKFSNGVVGTIQNSRRAVYGFDQRAEIFGSQGGISSENRPANQATLRRPDGIYGDRLLNFFIERYRDSYVEELVQFTQAVLQEAQSPLPGSEAKIPVLIGNAARQSYEENRPIRV